MCSPRARRILLWACLASSVVVSCIYNVLSLSTAASLIKATRALEGGGGRLWRVPAAAAALGGVSSLAFNLASCIVLLSKLAERCPSAVVALSVASGMLSVFVLLCGVVLDGFREAVSSQLEAKVSTWTASSTREFASASAFAFIAFVALLMACVLLVVFRPVVEAELGIAPAQPRAAPEDEESPLPAQRGAIQMRGLGEPDDYGAAYGAHGYYVPASKTYENGVFNYEGAARAYGPGAEPGAGGAPFPSPGGARGAARSPLPSPRPR
ncbi:hypothetical protein Rsub_10350 [Raphidocelis subcapitata]|uniref:Uncharacterized protein n=1 Tax=Raphidocelis subcapitata TaxID=307507 RepID=A0A2V0PGW8_9CHLO|nr:hypothetical protein Rsub_10350 [Raphidocelis subcapitata]|eukprot:GBF97163.1 hypothetical protein Rsub_10350 [Raphidocelis subcapitata]